RLAEGEPEVVGQVRWRVTDGASTVDLRGPNTCALLDPAEVAAVIDRLGPDPLRPDADAQKFIDRVLRSRSTIATLLMDQSVTAGTSIDTRTMDRFCILFLLLAQSSSLVS